MQICKAWSERAVEIFVRFADSEIILGKLENSLIPFVSKLERSRSG